MHDADVAQAVDEAERTAAIAQTDRVLTEALGALYVVTKDTDLERDAGATVAGILAMLATLCKEYVPGVMPQDFPTVELFSALAKDPEFAPLADKIVERVALELVAGGDGGADCDEPQVQPGVYRAELVPQLMPPTSSVTAQLFDKHVDVSAPYEETGLGSGDAANIARLIRLASALTGIPLNGVGHLLFFAMTYSDMRKLFPRNTNSVAQALDVLKKDWRKVAKGLVGLLQVGTTLTMYSNDAVGRLWPAFDALLSWTQVENPGSSASNTIANIRIEYPSVATVLRMIRLGQSNHGEGRSTLAIVRDYLWGCGRRTGREVAAWESWLTPTAGMTGMEISLKAWIDTVRTTPGFFSNSYYKEVETLHALALTVSTVVHYSAITQTFRKLAGWWEDLDRSIVMDKTFDLWEIRDKVRDLGQKMPDGDAMDPQTSEAQDKIDMYMEQLDRMPLSDNIDPLEVFRYAKALLAIRQVSEFSGWRVEGRNLIRLERTLDAIDKLAEAKKYQWLGASAARQPSASVVEHVFRGQA